MDNQNSQVDMSPDEAKASLGVANHLMSHLMPRAQQQTQDTQPQDTQAPQTSEPAPQPPTNQQTPEDAQAQMDGLEMRIMDELGTLKDEIRQVAGKNSGSEIETLKKEIEKILNE